MGTYQVLYSVGLLSDSSRIFKTRSYKNNVIKSLGKCGSHFYNSSDNSCCKEKINCIKDTSTILSRLPVFVSESTFTEGVFRRRKLIDVDSFYKFNDKCNDITSKKSILS